MLLLLLLRYYYPWDRIAIVAEYLSMAIFNLEKQEAVTGVKSAKQKVSTKNSQTRYPVWLSGSWIIVPQTHDFNSDRWLYQM